jgi:hypothetical protein
MAGGSKLSVGLKRLGVGAVDGAVDRGGAYTQVTEEVPISGALRQ